MDQQQTNNKPVKKGGSANTVLIIISVILIAVIIALVLVIVSQSKKNNDGGETDSGTKESETVPVEVNYADYYTVEYDDTFVDYDSADLSNYITLGQYKGIEVETLSTEVTEEDIDEAIKSDLYAKGYYSTDEVTDAILNGDIVSLSYVGRMDGVEFEGGTGSNDSLTIGSGAFIPGFEEGLIGSKAGETVTVKVTFPEVYNNNPDFAGRDAEFECTINSVSRLNYSELTDEILAEIGDYTSVEEYKKALSEKIALDKTEEAEYNKSTSVWTQVIDNAQVIKYPKSVLDNYMKEMIDYYTSYASYYGYTLDDYIKEVGAEKKEFYDACAKYAVSAAKEDLVLKSIAKAENITLSDEEYNIEAQKYCEQYYCDTIEELEEQYGKELVRSTILNDKIMGYVTDLAVEK